MSAGTLIVAVATTGLMAGLLAGFSVSVVPGLAKVDDRAFIDAWQRVNTAIKNPLFGLIFLGALVSGAVAAWRYADRADVFAWATAGLTGYAVTFVVTFVGNIPLNNRLDRAGPAAQLADPSGVRRAFERPWLIWHGLRTVACVVAFVCYCLALAAV
ncbi:DUF1772 domain-containing protein [Solwaraspora sp. WMMD937]|uniref:anthrone oxygenase family protein n=1 Tax=Solwaraspora sp. WMMD937 TaxID=3016090 RepID=UPI00249CDDA7|nr:DUF1772 domain-containing protein [Solwaraspora sp. WMMD937]WFE21811.1 DUF1772 domain-containing protein [Solwaraspora sp. WMMD937]